MEVALAKRRHLACAGRQPCVPARPLPLAAAQLRGCGGQAAQPASCRASADGGSIADTQQCAGLTCSALRGVLPVCSAGCLGRLLRTSNAGDRSTWLCCLLRARGCAAV